MDLKKVSKFLTNQIIRYFRSPIFWVSNLSTEERNFVHLIIPLPLKLMVCILFNMFDEFFPKSTSLGALEVQLRFHHQTCLVNIKLF